VIHIENSAKPTAIQSIPPGICVVRPAIGSTQALDRFQSIAPNETTDASRLSERPSALATKSRTSSAMRTSGLSSCPRCSSA
jgi:hypothetical protein